MDDSKLFEWDRLRLPENDVIASVATVDVSSMLMLSAGLLLTKLLEVAAPAPIVLGRRGRCSRLDCMILLAFCFWGIVAVVVVVLECSDLIEAVDSTDVTAEISSFISVNEELIESEFDNSFESNS